MKMCMIILVIAAQLYAEQQSVIITLTAPINGSEAPDTRSSSDPLVSHTQDSSIPSPTFFSWSIQGNSNPIVFDLFVSEDTVFDTSDFFEKNITDTFYLLWNLKIDTRYYWKVMVRDDRNNEWRSETGFFATNPSWPRMIQIDGTVNVRDIGGRKTPEGFLIRQGLFYRSAELGRHFPLTEKGIAQAGQLHIACDVDLRRMDEDPLPGLPAPVRYIHPLKDDSSNGVYQYREGLASTGDVYAKVFKALSEKRNYPLILHCYAGLDRTGTVVAILEALLGCSEQQMGEDYQWSCLSQFSRKDTTDGDWKGTISYLKSFDEKDSTVQAGAWNYLLKQGVATGDIVSIRKILINDDQIPPFVSVKNPTAARGRFLRPTIFHQLSASFITLVPIKNNMQRFTVFNCQGKRILELSGCEGLPAKMKRLDKLGPGVYFVSMR